MIGSRLGSYEIVEEIGRGGMATVYRAYQPNVDRFVAIKVMRQSAIGDQQAATRFQREARLVARLEHPHLLPIYDFDCLHNPPYLVMRYLESGTLRDVLQQALIPLAEANFLLQQIGKALDYAHRQGVVHRDIKPSNIMLDQEGNAFLSDFGIARLLKEAETNNSGLTRTGAIIGTPNYISPEQITSQDDVDHRADIYALGVMLFQMLTGVLPFNHKTSAHILVAHMHDPVPYATDFNKTLPTMIDEIIFKAMAKSPTDRYQGILPLLDDLSQVTQQLRSKQPRTVQTAVLHTIQSSQQKRTENQAYEQKLMAQFTAKRKPTHPANKSTKTPPLVTGQHKQMTALYANLAEYISYIEETDIESAQESIPQLWQALEKAIVEHNGIVRQQTNDDLVAIWGVQATKENDPEQAILAALAMQTQLRDFLGKTEEAEIPMQIGIDTGSVLVTWDKQAYKFHIHGYPITLSRRLERGTPIGQILVSHHTYRHVRGLFDFEPADPLRLHTSKESLATYLVKGHKGSRLFHVKTRGIEGVETRMIGRKIELNQLREAFYATVEEQETQVITIVSEPGLGKSRLLYEFYNWIDLGEIPVHWLRGWATPTTSQNPQALLRTIFTQRFNILDNDTPAEMAQKLEAGISRLIQATQTPYQPEMAHLIGYLIGFDFSHKLSTETATLDREALETKAIAAFEQFIVTVSRQEHPIVMAIEDIHWADDNSLDILNHLTQQHQNVPLLVIYLTRPNLYHRRPHWGKGQQFHLRLDLRPLSRRQSRQLAREILKEANAVPTALRDLLVEHAEGNPFFMEEIVKVLIDDRVIVKEGPRWQVILDRLSGVRIPATLTGLMQTRLDSLFPIEQLILKRASVIGPIFWQSTVQELETADTRSVDVAAVLGTLCQRELIYVREESIFKGTNEYVFRSVMLRDVVYESLPSKKQQQYHALVALWLIDQSGERVGEQAKLISQHLISAKQEKDAILFLEEEAQQAVLHSQYHRGIELYEELVTLTSSTASYDFIDPELREKRLTALNELGQLLRTVGNNEMALNYYEQYVLEADSNVYAVAALHSIGHLLQAQGAYQASIERLQQAIHLSQQLKDITGQANALAVMAYTYLIWGKYKLAWEHCTQAVRLYKLSGSSINQYESQTLIGVAYHYSTQFKQAINHFQIALTIAQQLALPDKIVIALNKLGETHQALFNMEQAYTYHQQALIIIKQQFRSHRIESDIYRNIGLELHYLGHHDEAIQYLQRALKVSPKHYIEMFYQSLYALSFVYYEMGNENDSYQYAQQLLTLAQEKDVPHHLAAALYMIGLYHHQQGQQQEAEQTLHQALEQANIGNLLLLWRIHAALAETTDDATEASKQWAAAATIIQQIAQPLTDETLQNTFLQAKPIQTILEKAST